MGREPLPKRSSLTPSPCGIVVLCGISTCFQMLSPSLGQVIHVLLTRAPLRCQPKSTSPFDLHVLGTPPAFVLSQDQTLELIPDHLRSISIPQALVYFFWPLTLVFSLAGPSNLLDRFLNYLLVSRSFALYSFQGAPRALSSRTLVRSLSALDKHTKSLINCQHSISTFFDLIFATCRKSLNIRIIFYTKNFLGD